LANFSLILENTHSPTSGSNKSPGSVVCTIEMRFFMVLGKGDSA